MDDEACGSWELVMDEFKSPTKTRRGAQSTPPFAPQKAPAKPQNRDRLVKRLNLDYIEDVDSDSDSDDSSSDYEEEKPYYNPLPNSFKIQEMNKVDPSSDDEDELDDEQDDDPSSDYEEEEDELDNEEDELDDDRESDDDPSSDYEDEGEDGENDDKLYRKYTDKSDWDNQELLLS